MTKYGIKTKECREDMRVVSENTPPLNALVVDASDCYWQASEAKIIIVSNYLAKGLWEAPENNPWEFYMSGKESEHFADCVEITDSISGYSGVTLQSSTGGTFAALFAKSDSPFVGWIVDPEPGGGDNWD